MHEVPTFVFDALRFQDPRVDKLRLVKDPEWGGVLSSWRVVRLTLPLRQLWGEYLPDWVRDRIDSFLVDNAVRFQRVKQLYSGAATAFKDAKAEHVVMKGFSLWPGYVEHPRFRPQSDIDVYCPPESIFRARDALSELGYQPFPLGAHLHSDHLLSMGLPTSWQWRGRPFDPDIPPSFELHSSLWNTTLTRIRPPGLGEFWSRRIERQLDEISFGALHPVDNLGYTALNLLRDLLLGAVALEQAYGLARFLHTSIDDRPFWRDWRSLHDERLRRLEMISFRLVSEWYTCCLPEEVQEEMERLPPPVLAWLGHFSGDALSPHFQQRKDGLWLHLTLLESGKDRSFVWSRSLLRVPSRFPTFGSVLAEETTKDSPAKKSSTSKVLKFCSQSFRYAGWFARATCSRVIHLPLALSRGLGFWVSSHNLSRQFWTFLTASLCFDLGMTMFFFLYNLLLLDRGYKEEFLGLMMGAMNVGSLAGSIPAGILVQWLGLRSSTLLCFSLVSSVSVACTLFGVRSVLFGLAFLAGFVSAIWAVAISPAIASLTDERSRPFGFSLVFASGMGVSVLASLVASRMPGWFSHLNPALLSLQSKQFALLVACAIVALGLYPLSRLQFARLSLAVAEKKLYPRDPFVWKFLLAVGLWSVVTGSLSPLSNVYFFQFLRMPLERMGVIFSFSSLLQVLGILGAPFLFRRLGLVSGIAASQITTAALLALLAITTKAGPAAVIYIGFSGFLWMSEPGLRTLLMGRVAPIEQTGASALNFFVNSLVQALAVAATGISFSKFGYPAVLAALAGIALLASVSFLGLIGRHSAVVAKSASARECAQETGIGDS